MSNFPRFKVAIDERNRGTVEQDGKRVGNVRAFTFSARVGEVPTIHLELNGVAEMEGPASARFNLVEERVHLSRVPHVAVCGHDEPDLKTVALNCPEALRDGLRPVCPTCVSMVLSA